MMNGQRYKELDESCAVGGGTCPASEVGLVEDSSSSLMSELDQ